MSNLFKIKRGATVPTSDVLSAYELGFMTEGGKLYIGLGDSVKMLAAGPSSTLPKAAGNASVGTEDTFARGDHIHPLQTSVSGNAGTATKLETARTIQINLASTSSASFDGSSDINPGVTGTLPISHGGTGATTAADACVNLGAVKKSGDTMTGTLTNTSTITIQRDTYPTLYYNTAAGKNKAAVICSAGAADHNGGIILRGWNSDSSDYKDLVLTYANSMAVPVSNGGTGATNAAHANQNLFNSGDLAYANVTVYPTVPGIYRTVGTNIFSNLTDVHSNYGVLIIFKAIYALHLYIDANGYFFWGYSGDDFREPTNWYGINRLSNNCYGAYLPSPGIPGRLFYKKV